MQKISYCHGMPVTTSTADEGTSCYICSSCGNPCDLMPEKQLYKPKATIAERWQDQVRAFYPADHVDFTIRFINGILGMYQRGLQKAMRDGSGSYTPEQIINHLFDERGQNAGNNQS